MSSRQIGRSRLRHGAGAPLPLHKKDTTLMTFSTLGLAEPIVRALAETGYAEPTPIQGAAIPVVLTGRDLVAIAQTGTGKTAAFALPILNHLALAPKRPAPARCRVLVLSPTRELSGQIADSFRKYGKHMRVGVTLAIGGVPIGRQIRALKGGIDILVATPGRLLDLQKTRALALDAVEILVLDEADRMLDMGFIADIRRIVAMLPKERQTLFFSATMPAEIARLANEMLTNPERVSVAPPSTTAERIDQRFVKVSRADKPGMLVDLLGDAAVERSLVFTRTKHGADKVARVLVKAGIAADAIHGNRSQGQRERALAAFRDGSVRTLVATDIAARGIDVAGISHVFNYDLPEVPETYVHRIGRTARAGRAGIAISLCSAEEQPLLKRIEMLLPRSARSADSDEAEAPAARASSGRGEPRRDGGRGEPRKDGGRGQRPRRRRGNGGGGNGKPSQPAHAAGQRTAHSNYDGNDMGGVPFMKTPRRGGGRPNASTPATR